MRMGRQRRGRPSGGIFSFERLQRLFAASIDATPASEAAVAARVGVYHLLLFFIAYKIR
jgi:hypothetical protein